MFIQPTRHPSLFIYSCRRFCVGRSLAGNPETYLESIHCCAAQTLNFDVYKILVALVCSACDGPFLSRPWFDRLAHTHSCQAAAAQRQRLIEYRGSVTLIRTKSPTLKGEGWQWRPRCRLVRYLSIATHNPSIPDFSLGLSPVGHFHFMVFIERF